MDRNNSSSGGKKKLTLRDKKAKFIKFYNQIKMKVQFAVRDKN